MTNVLEMPKNVPDAKLVAEIKTLVARLAAAMNEAEQRAITVDFNIAKTAAIAQFTVTRLEIRKLL